MLSVTLYEFKKRENSTKRPDASATQRTHEAVLKMPTSLLNPEISFDFGLKGNPSFYNYAYISDLGNRYYFIRDWTVSEGHIWTAHMEVDVLASWKGSIGASTQYIKRSSYTYDGGIMDNVYPTKQPPQINLSQSASPWSTTSLASGCYVVGIINNKDGGMGAAHYYMFTQDMMNKLLAYMLGGVEWMGTITDISDSLLKVLMNPIQYIVSCIWYPFQIDTDSTAVTQLSKTPLGWWELDVPCYQLNTTIKYFQSDVDVAKHPQAGSRGTYLNKQPYTTYTLYYPGVGSMAIDPSLITTDTLSIQCAVDLIANQARLTVSSMGIIAVEFSQIGVPIQLAQMASQALQAIGGTIQGIAGMATGAATGAGSALVGAYGASAASFLGMASSFFGAIGNAVESAYPQTTKLSANGSIVGLAYPVQLKAIFYLLVDEDNADLGRPLCKARQVSSLPGFQMCMHADIAIAGTAQENQKIKSYMESGYFYE